VVAEARRLPILHHRAGGAKIAGGKLYRSMGLDEKTASIL
jgi:hypothetical protein